MILGKSRNLKLLCSTLLTASLAACGGGGGGSSDDAAAEAADNATTTQTTGGGNTLIQTSPDSALTAVNDPVSIDVLANDDAELELQNFNTTTSSGGVIQRNDRGTADRGDDRLIYIPANNFSGNDSFTYTVGNTGGERIETVTVQVRDNAITPSANADIAYLPTGSSVDVAVLNNDSSNETTPFTQLTTFESTSREGGTVRRIDSGTALDQGDDLLRYTPPQGFTGNDSFDYQISNSSGASAFSTVNVIVAATQVAAACDDNVNGKRAAGDAYCVSGRLRTRDNALLSFRLFVPAEDALRSNAATANTAPGASDPGFAPLLVHSHGFGEDNEEDFSNPAGTADSHRARADRQIALDAWNSGYWVISLSQRGQGIADNSRNSNTVSASSGPGQLQAPDAEGLDFVELVNWANCQLKENFNPTTLNPASPVSPLADNCGQSLGRSLLRSDSGNRAGGLNDDIALGTLGFGAAAGFQFNAQSVDPRVDAILPMAAWHDLGRALQPNDTAKSFWLQLLASADQTSAGAASALLQQALVEATNGNQDSTDSPHNKGFQLSVDSLNALAARSPLAYCDNNAAGYAANHGDADGEPVDFGTLPANAVSQRAARADLLLIQGLNDSLFDFNEGFDNARCFETAGNNLDVRFIAQLSGHPGSRVATPAANQHYAGVDSDFYTDEILHCGSGNSALRYNTRELGLRWFDDKLRQDGDFDSYFPHKVCISQANTDPGLVLDADDATLAGNTDHSGENAYRFPREGLVLNAVSDVTVGGATAFPLNSGTAVQTGSAMVDTGHSPTLYTLYTVPANQSQVMAGIPLANLTLRRSDVSIDEIVFAGIAVTRCHRIPGSSGACESGIEPELLHYQTTPLRLFAAAGSSSSVSFSGDFPREDFRNGLVFPDNLFYSQRFGADPGNSDNAGQTRGRLSGVSVRLHSGDRVSLLVSGGHSRFPGAVSEQASSVTVSGQVWLPLQVSSIAPSAEPAYFLRQP